MKRLYPCLFGWLILFSFAIVQPALAQNPGDIENFAGSGTAGEGGGGFSGDGGAATAALLSNPTGMAVDASGNVYLTDTGNHRIRKIDAGTGIINTVAGNGTADFTGDGGDALQATLHFPQRVFVNGNDLYIADQRNHAVRHMDLTTGVITTVAGDGFGAGNFNGGRFTGDGGQATSASLNMPADVHVDGNNLYIADEANQAVRRVDLSTGIITTVAGTGTSGFNGDNIQGNTAQLFNPRGVAVFGGLLYIGDSFNNRIRQVDPGTGVITTVAGIGTSGSTGDGGVATAAQLSSPTDVFVSHGGHLYIADSGGRQIRRVDAGTGNIELMAGTGASGFSGDGGPATAALLNTPRGVHVHTDGHLYIADTENHRIRKVLEVEPAQVVQQPEVKVTVGMDLVAPGQEVRIPILLLNENAPPVGGLQMDVAIQDAAAASYTRLEDGNNVTDFAMQANEATAGEVSFVAFSQNNATIPTGAQNVQLATLIYTVDQNAALGSTNTLTIQGLQVGDGQAQPIQAVLCHGSINVGIRGDIDLDGDIDIFDVILLARILVGNDPTPADGTTAFKIADGDGNGTLNVVDILYQINDILGLPNPPNPRPIVGSPVTATLADAVTLADGRTAIPLALHGSATLGGMEVVMQYDPSSLIVDTPILTDGLTGIELVSRVEDGMIRLIAFRTDRDALLPADGRPVVLVPVRNGNGIGAPEVTLLQAGVVTTQMYTPTVIIGQATAPIPTGRTGLPGAFALGGNAPNPFNPSTTISYEIPVQARVQLVVYNLLGQEVVRLVDKVQTAGRHRAVWDARNTQGLSVASGVYVYRLISDTGYTESRRMTLLK